MITELKLVGYTLAPQDLVTARRMLNMGPPNSGKTESLLTWIRPIAIQVFPGEKGDATIPRGLPDVLPFVWSDNPVSKMSSHDVVQAVETLSWEILGGKYGEIRTFAGDGLHKYYWYLLDWISGGQLARGEELGSREDKWAAARIHSRARDYFRFYVQRVLASPVENVVFTSWDGAEADQPGVLGSPSHIFPDFPGKTAKEIVGEFSVVVHSTVDWHLRQPGKRAPAFWQLIPEGKVWGASIKLPMEVKLRLPVKIEQSFPTLVATLEKAWTGTIPSK